jgi:hypothetical protein
VGLANARPSIGTRHVSVVTVAMAVGLGLGIGPALETGGRVRG